MGVCGLCVFIVSCVASDGVCVCVCDCVCVCVCVCGVHEVF